MQNPAGISGVAVFLFFVMFYPPKGVTIVFLMAYDRGFAAIAHDIQMHGMKEQYMLYACEVSIYK